MTNKCSDTAETIKAIKKELRAAMNGIASARMREAGMPYRLAFGVELPRLQDIAKEFEPSRELAQQLWNENVRECKILASLLMPADGMLAEVAEIWVDEIPTAEIAQTCCMFLFSKQKWAAERAFEWIASESQMRQTCGFLIIARLLQQGAELNERSRIELVNQAHSLLPQATLPLRKAILATLAKAESEE